MRVIIIGLGDVAQRLLRSARHWPQAKHVQWTALVRRTETAVKARSLGARPLLADLDDFRSLRRLRAYDAVLYFAPPPSTGVCDPRLRRVLAVLAPCAVPLVYVSTTGVYGNCQGAWIDETRPVRPESDRAKRRVEAEAQLRRRYQWRAARLRAPGIYAEDRLPLERIRRATPALVHEEDSYSNHIHAEDLARACWLAVFRAKPQRAYNIVDGSALKMGQWFDAVADAHGLPRVPRVPAAQLSAQVSPELWSFLRESRRISGDRYRRELRMTPRPLRLPHAHSEHSPGGKELRGVGPDPQLPRAKA